MASMVEGERAARRDGVHGGAFAIALVGALGLLGAAAGCDDPSRGGRAATKAFGEACARDEECASAVCAAIGGVCSKTCQADRECGTGYVCRARQDRPGSECSKPMGLALGAECMTAAECQHGRCLHRAGQTDRPGFCSVRCESAKDCPASLSACEQVSDSEGMAMCLPGGAGAGAAATPGPEVKASERSGGKADGGGAAATGR
ncbi:hypothetical protein [Sorangium sp. So ce1151]|uniref:hypothetical protein n=1 Tax=Sorangium sp. So ce1151 TaxID=3133332 RepID=UPI003F5F7BAF